ncbi:alpha/beta fold hydrolase [Novosphingobium sp. CF614]|uniref:alpha/beta fold hydrolase n=1 Tax=Novosphingobium sp. CF614 TaxID=1884364 RepID=UPI001C42E4E4|nr:alpha/beta hydrolase [Novosphingobium sp. CF614]
MIDARRAPEPMAISGWMTTSDGARVPYRIKGEGPPLLMIHGWSQSGAMFQHQLDTLSDRYRVIVPDLRGHGQSPAPAGGLRISRLARDIHELLAILGIERAALLGWSMGVSVILSFIDLFGTDQIDRLVLVDQPSSLMIASGMPEQERVTSGALFGFGELGDLAASLSGPAGEEVRAGFVRGMVSPAISDELLDWILKENARTAPDLAARLLVNHCMQDWRDVLRRIDRPTLVTGGAVSHVDPRSQRFLHEQIPQSRYYEFGADEGGAHFPFLEAPDRFNDVISSFLVE